MKRVSLLSSQLIVTVILISTSFIQAFAQSAAPLDVEYNCENGKFTGKLNFVICLPPGAQSDGYRCFFESAFPTKTHPTGVGLAGVGVTFLLSSLSTSSERFFCLRSVGGGYEGDLSGPLPFGTSTVISGFSETSSPKDLSDCSLWVKRGKPFNVQIVAYEPADLLTVTDALTCELKILAQ